MERVRTCRGVVDRYRGFRMPRVRSVRINRTRDDARKQGPQRAFPTESRHRQSYRETTCVGL